MTKSAVVQPQVFQHGQQSVPLDQAPKESDNSEVWYSLRVVLGVHPDGSYKVRSVTNSENSCMRRSNRNRPTPVTEAALREVLPALMATPGNGISATVPNSWCFHFAMHVDGTPWIGDLNVPDLVIAKAQEIVTVGP